MTEKIKGEVEYDDLDITPPIDYISLPFDLELSDPRSAIAESWAINSSKKEKCSRV